jgi:hypothetical protein
MDRGVFWLMSIALLMLAAGVLQLIAVRSRRRPMLADGETQNLPPAPFEASAHPNEDFPVTRKAAVYDDKLTYPLKVYVELMNNTAKCSDVKISRWVNGPGVKAEVFGAVLQLWMDDGWFPKPNGRPTLHVPPGERFRLWIAPDKQHSLEEVQRLCDGTGLGALMLRINGEERGILL